MLDNEKKKKIVNDKVKAWSEREEKSELWKEILRLARQITELIDKNGDVYSPETLIAIENFKIKILQSIEGLIEHGKYNELKRLSEELAIYYDFVFELSLEFAGYYLIYYKGKNLYGEKLWPSTKLMQSKYLFLSLYGKIDIAKSKAQGIMSYLNSCNDEEFTAFEKRIVWEPNKFMKKGVFDFIKEEFEYSQDDFLKTLEKAYRRAGKLRDKLSHGDTVSQIQMSMIHSTGDKGIMDADIMNEFVWITLAILTIYVDSWNEEFKKMYKLRKERFDEYLKSEIKDLE